LPLAVGPIKKMAGGKWVAVIQREASTNGHQRD